MCGPVAQWIRHLTTNQGIPGSNPGGVDYFSEGKRGKTLVEKIGRKTRVSSNSY